MRFVAAIEKFALAIRRHSENLPLIAGRDEESAVGAKSEIPDVFRFRVEEDGFFPGWRNAIDLAVRRCGHIKHTFGVEGNCLRDEIGRLENDGGLAWGAAFKAENLCRGPAGGVKRALRIDAQRPEIGCVRIGDKRKFRRKLQPAVAAHRHAVRSAFKKIFIGGLAPGPRVLGQERRRGECEETKKGRNAPNKKGASGLDALRETALRSVIHEWWHWSFIEFAGLRR